MIVRTFPDGLQLITQPDHAHLARSVMTRCAPLAERPRRDSILLAIGEHDAGWDIGDAALGVDVATGEIHNFINAPLSVRQGVWPRSVGLLELEPEPWAAALVAQHAITIYERFRDAPDWRSFFAEMTASRDALVRAGGGELDALLADYVFLRLGDLISLAFCTSSTDEQGFGGWTVRQLGGRVEVSPDPFAGAKIPLEIAARELPRRRFRSDLEARQELDQAPWTTLRGHVEGRSSLPPT